MPSLTLNVNGESRTVEVRDPDEPLLYVLRNALSLTGAKFGCGLGQCGACTVIVDGEAVRSCRMPVSKAAGNKITTIEGLGTPDKPHPLQAAFVAEQAAQCGYCVTGMVMTGAVALARKPNLTSRGCAAGARRQSLPLRNARPHPARHAARLGQGDGMKRARYRAVNSCRPAARLSSVSPFRYRPMRNVRAVTCRLARRSTPAEVDGFIAVNADGSVTIFSGKVDLGQGLRIAIPQMAAEELGIGVDRIAMVEGDTALTPDQGPTAGSSGIMRGGVQIRQAAATAREALDRPRRDPHRQVGGGFRHDRRRGAAEIGRRRHSLRRSGRRQALRRQGRSEGEAPRSRVVHDRRSAARAARHPGQGRRPPRVRPRFQGRRHAARPRRPAAGGRREARRRRRGVDRGDPGRARRAGQRFSRRRRRRRMGRRVGRAHAEGAAGRSRRRCSAHEAVRALDARRPVRGRRDAGEKRRRASGACRREESQRGILLADAVARVDGAVVRGRRRSRRQGDGLVGVASDASLPRDDRQGARAAEGCRARRLSRRLRLLRHERP